MKFIYVSLLLGVINVFDAIAGFLDRRANEIAGHIENLLKEFEE